jgi:hypothetical protein
MKASEFFYLDANGHRADAELHEAILAAGDNATAQEVTRKLLARAGWAEAEIQGLLAED